MVVSPSGGFLVLSEPERGSSPSFTPRWTVDSVEAELRGGSCGRRERAGLESVECLVGLSDVSSFFSGILDFHLLEGFIEAIVVLGEKKMNHNTFIFFLFLL